MKTLLHIKASLFADHGQSSQLSDAYVGNWRARHADGRVITRDFARQPMPHLDGAAFQAFLTPPEQRDAEQRAAADHSDALIAELAGADTLVIGLPMYNLGVPSMLKSWFDHVMRAGKTFRYTDAGPQGLLTGKKALVFATRGGRYAGTAGDVQTQYVRNVLGFMGITEVEFVYAEGLAMGDAAKAAGLAAAHGALAELAV
ncbi:MAG: NAD(P)H-dependent oxidoreductase [Burkholderiaceae bacterium]